MFLDASALIAILGNEPEKPSLLIRFQRATKIAMSPVSIYEAAVGLARKRMCPLPEARELVDDFIRDAEIEVMAVDATIGQAALDAFQRFGKGRHRAALNMGDCFAYACAKSRNVPLLFKGDDFGHTDIAVA